MQDTKLVKKKMVDTWLVYGLMAALFWGTYIIVSKVVTGDKYFGFNTAITSSLMLVGIAIVFVGYFLYTKPSIPTSSTGIILGIFVGVLWAGGMLASFLALKSGADVSKLTPLYNTNTLIAVVLGIILLHELPQAGSMIKVILGALLIVMGGILVSG